MVILFQVFINIENKEIAKFSKEEQKVIKKFLDQVNLIPDKTNFLDAKDTKNKIKEILEKNKRPDINVKGMVLVLTSDEIKILESVFERLGYEFKAEILPSNHNYSKAWNDKFSGENDIKGFFEYVYIGKEIQLPNSSAKSKQKLQIYEIDLNTIGEKIDNTSKKISDLKNKYYEDDKNNKKEESKNIENKQKEETKREITIKEPIIIEGINFNKKADEKDESSYKVEKLVNEGIEIEYQADLSQNIKNSNKKRSDELLNKINEAVKSYNIQFKYSNGYPKRIDKSDGKIWYVVKLEEKSIEKEKLENPVLVYKNEVWLGEGNNRANFNKPLNKNDPNSKYKFEVLIEGQEVEYNYSAFNSIKDTFIAKINEITGKKYRFSAGYPKEVKKGTFKVKIEEVKEI